MENLAMTFCYLWLTEKLCAPQSPPIYLGCYALHYGIMNVSILYTLYIQIVC